MKDLIEARNHSFDRICGIGYHASELTRNDYYLLPALPGHWIYPATFESVFRKMIKHKRVRLLDLGCGAGTWAEDQAFIPGTEVYGISAKDYRRRENRPEITFTGWLGDTNEPMYLDGGITLIGEKFARSIQLGDEQYLIGDAHDLLPRLSASSFEIIVSYQACRYLFDPLAILEQIHRLLSPNGYAFLESFQPVINNADGQPINPKIIERYLLRHGHQVCYGYYSPDLLHRKFGLALKKTRAELHLPVTYTGTTTTDTIEKLKTETVVYHWGS